jgi:hypothetical protein
MAKGKKTGGKDFKPGETGNPNGRPPVPADLREARSLNKVELERILNKYVFLPLAEIKAELERPGTPALEVIIGKVIAEAIRHGDERRLAFLLERLVGPVKRVHEHSGPDGKPIPVREEAAALSSAEIDARIKELLKKNGGKNDDS